MPEAARPAGCRRYSRRDAGATCSNHTPGTAASFPRLTEFLGDFKMARVMEVEGGRQFEAYGTLSGAARAA